MKNILKILFVFLSLSGYAQTTNEMEGAVIAQANQTLIREYNEAGDVLFEKGDFKKAISAYNYVLNIDKLNYRAHFNKASAEAILGDLKEAWIDYTACLVIYITRGITNHDLYYRRGDVAYRLGEFDSACKDWVESANLGNQRARLMTQKYCH